MRWLQRGSLGQGGTAAPDEVLRSQGRTCLVDKKYRLLSPYFRVDATGKCQFENKSILTVKFKLTFFDPKRVLDCGAS